MSVVSTFDGKNCSTVWVKLLSQARADGVSFHLNSGYRSVAEQWVLYNKYKAGKGPIAAYPGSSTHNKVGWQQGCDVGPTTQNTQAVINWAAKKGIHLSRTVPSEFWHLNASSDFSSKLNHTDHKLAVWRHHLGALRTEAKQHGWSSSAKRIANQLKVNITRRKKAIK